MIGATTDHLVEASEAAGIDTDLPSAVQAHYSWARSRGYGAESWSRIIDAIRPYARG